MLRNKIAPLQMSAIIQRLSINNINFSREIIKLLLTVLTEAKGSEDVAACVNLCLGQLLATNDVYTFQRIEMILGCGLQTQIKKDNRIYSIEEEVYSFTSTIENLYPAEPLLYYCFSNKTMYNHDYLDSP